MVTESVLRNMYSIHKASLTFSNIKLMIRVFEEIGSQDLLNLNEHYLNTFDGINNHGVSLVRLIFETYLKLRNFHICRLTNDEYNKVGKRQHLNRSIIFEHL